MRCDYSNPGDSYLKAIPGFYPTPARVVGMMLERLGPLTGGDRVLEPSAGRGDIADRLASYTRSLTLVEPHPDLATCLRRKGYEPVEVAFEQFRPAEPFDKVAMNPPFAGGRDLIHVRHAFAMLAPGGVLVALMNDGDDPRDATTAQRVEFAEWLSSDPSIDTFRVERLPQALFMGGDNFRPTKVPMKLATLHRCAPVGGAGA